jgi:hypothetical protein
VLSAVDGEIEVAGLCQRLAHTLAQERLEDVVVLGPTPDPTEQSRLPLKQIATRLGRNLWSLEEQECAMNGMGVGSLPIYLSAARAEFAYSIVAAPPVSVSDSAVRAAQCSDGMVLVLSLRNTRRISALNVKNQLEDAGVRLLGTVLMDREFPIPAGLYRRL